MNIPMLRAHRVRGFAPMLTMLLPLAGVLAACSNDATTTPTATTSPSSASFGRNVSGSTQRILFTSNRDGNDGNFELYSIKPDGTGATRLTNAAGRDEAGVWSPDGKQIAFRSLRDDAAGEIYVMNSDGTNVVRLTDDVACDDTPSWSKDGRQIVFASTRDAAVPQSCPSSDFEVYVMNADGSGVVRLTNNASFDGSPTFSPDGRRIAWVSGRDHFLTDAPELYTMDPDGTRVTRLTFQDGKVGYPSWDPRGRRLAFHVIGSADADGIFTLDLDISGLTRLTFAGSVRDAFPSWSADGSQLVFTSNRDGGVQLYVMNADGSNPTRLTSNQAIDQLPRWSR